MSLAGPGLLLAAACAWAAPHDGLHERIDALTGAIEQAPGRAALRLERADLHRLHANWEAALADLDGARALEPDLPRIDLARARLLADMGCQAAARAHLDVYLAAQPDDGAALRLLGALLVELGEHAAAAGAYTRALEGADACPEDYLLRAEALLALGGEQTEAALAGLDEGLVRLGPVVTLQLRAIDLELALGRTDRALQRLDRIAGASDRQERWLVWRGEILLEAGRWPEAREAFGQALDALGGLPVRLRGTSAVRALEARVRAGCARLDESDGGPRPTR